MPLEVKKPNSLIEKIWRRPVYERITWWYQPARHGIPAAREEAATTIKQIGNELHLHPSYVDWGGILPYRGAIFSAIREVDRPEMEESYPEGKAGIPASYTYPLSWGNQLLKVGVSFCAMMHQFSLPLIGVLGVPVDFLAAATYLGLNAVRNATADLISKHWVNPRVWLSNLGHIKWNKLTSSLLVTSLAFPILSFIKEGVHQLTAAYGGLEFAATFLAITLVDSGIQFATRRWRGFDREVAKLDMLRPIVGDLGAVLLFWSLGWDMGVNFGYLVTRKVFAEIWSGGVEGRQKYREKIVQRRKNFHKIFDLNRYRASDPAALAAVNLVYIMATKSMARHTYRQILREGGIGDYDLRLNIKKVHLAMCDDRRIETAVKFIFPHDHWRDFAIKMLAAFQQDRNKYLCWIKKYDPLFFQTVMTDILNKYRLAMDE